MNFDLSDDAKALREEAGRFLAERSARARARRAGEAGASHDPELWEEVARLGWPAAAAPEALGGAGMGYEALCVLAEQCGAALAPIPLLANAAAIEALLLAGDAAQQERWVPALASGRVIGTLALGEGIGEPAPSRMGTRFESGLLHGTKWPVLFGMEAEVLVVAARHEDRAGLVLVEGDVGIARSRIATVDPNARYARMDFEGAPAAPLPGARDAAGVARLLDRLAVITAFEQVGGARACLDMALEHARQRMAFARPIGSFQAVKHKLADMFVNIELASSAGYFGCWTLASGLDETGGGATARILASDAFAFAAREAIHVHGAQGFAWEQDCHLYFRRARMLAGDLGTPRYWKERLMTSLEAADGL